jgi:dienelactone hydrolase
MKFSLSLLLLLAVVWDLRAEIRVEPIEYKHDNTILEGAFIHDSSKSGRRPAVLIVHQWKGLGDYERKRGEMLARLGYNVLAVDIYGKGVRPADPKEAAKEAAKYKDNRNLLRARVNAGLDLLKKNERSDPGRIAAIGYCFGGTTVLELARSGADLAGVVSFHGGLGTPVAVDAKQIRCKVLALHGADDPFVPPAEVEAFQEEMRKGGVDWQLIAYGGAVHSFTDWNGGSDPSKGSAYNEKADHRSWAAMQQFFAELFR